MPYCVGPGQDSLCMDPNHSPFTGCAACGMEEIWRCPSPNSRFYWMVDGIWGANESNWSQRHDTLGVVQMDHQDLYSKGLNVEEKDEYGNVLRCHHIDVVGIDTCNDKKMRDCLHGHHTSMSFPCPYCRCSRNNFWDTMGTNKTFASDEIKKLRQENVFAKASGLSSAACNVESAGYEGYDDILGTCQ